MSAPSAGSPNGSPVPGYYPDPSIPGYIRYWNGSSWTPGTSRPAPGPGEPAPAPPAEAGGHLPASRTGVPAPEGRGNEEDDRDEIDLGRARSDGDSLPEVRRRGEITAADPAAGGEFTNWDDPRRLHGGAPEPASAWQADVRQQSGFGDDRQDLSWASPDQSTPAAAAPDPAAPAGGRDPHWVWDAPAGDAAAGSQPPPADRTMGIRMPRPEPGDGGQGQAGHGQAGQVESGQGEVGQGLPAAQPELTVGLWRSDVLGQGGPPAGAQQGARQPAAGYQQPPAPYDPYDPYGGQGHGAADSAPGAGYAAQQGQQPPQGAPPGPAWAQQVQQLAQQDAGQAPAPVPGAQHVPGQPNRGAEGLAPWRPPADDPFSDVAQDARPAGLGKRLVARLIDGLVVGAVVGATALPFVGKWTEHIQEQIEATNQAGVARTIWLVDGTTGVYLAVVLGAFLLFGLLYEALPTAKWGRTLGKKLLGIQVLDIERQDSPGFGAALRRWLTYSLLSLVVLGVVDAMWCLFDRPWRQCWHDKAARTFVADR